MNVNKKRTAINIYAHISLKQGKMGSMPTSSPSIYPCPQLHLSQRVAYYQNHRCWGDDGLSGGEREGGEREVGREREREREGERERERERERESHMHKQSTTETGHEYASR